MQTKPISKITNEKKDKALDRNNIPKKCRYWYAHIFWAYWGFIVVKSNSFIRFLEETLAWKNHFDFGGTLCQIPLIRVAY